MPLLVHDPHRDESRQLGELVVEEGVSSRRDVGLLRTLAAWGGLPDLEDRVDGVYAFHYLGEGSEVAIENLAAVSEVYEDLAKAREEEGGRSASQKSVKGDEAKKGKSGSSEEGAEESEANPRTPRETEQPYA